MAFFVYLVECADKTFYCGYTKDLKARVKAHNEGKGAKYTRARRPVRLVYFEEKSSLKQAMQRELRIKKMPRKEKEKLIKNRLLKAVL